MSTGLRKGKQMARPTGLEKKKFCLSLDIETYTRLQEIAEKAHLPVNAVITGWVWKEEKADD